MNGYEVSVKQLDNECFVDIRHKRSNNTRRFHIKASKDGLEIMSTDHLVVYPGSLYKIKVDNP